MSKFNFGEGHVLLQIVDQNGNEIRRREGRNLVVQRGMAMLARRIWGSPNTAAGPRRVQYMELGKGGAVAASNQTDLITALNTPAARGVVTVTQIGGANGRTAQWQHTWTAKEFSATGIEEVGLFNSPTTNKGTMFSRFVFTTVNKAKTDTLKITWTLKVK